jgi:hypothetical protein
MDVWAAQIDDAPGGLARTLRAIADVGADLDCVLARRESTTKGKGVVFVTPLHGKEQLENAGEIGLHRAEHIATLKIEGDDRPGMGADLAKVMGETGANLHGLTAMVVGGRFVCYASFDSTADLERAEAAIHTLDSRPMKKWREILHRKQRQDATAHV